MEDKLTSKILSLEKSIKAIGGTDHYGGTSFSELCLFPEVQYPPKFKIPDFTQYDGSGCPYTHLKIYCGELGAAGYGNEKLCMQLFQKSLTGSALRWFVEDYSKFRSWDDLTTLFLRHYNFNNEVLPDRFELQRNARKVSETFREYAQRWREMAARVKPPLDETELVSTLIHTLPDFYYSHLFTCVGKPFSDLVRNGEMLDDGVKTGRIRIPEGQSSTSNKRSTQPKADKPSVSAIFPGQNSAMHFPPQSSNPPQGVTGQKEWLPRQQYIEGRKKWVFTPFG